MNIKSTLKKLLIVASVFALVVGGFLTHALAGLNAQPVVFAPPPAFVEQYAANMQFTTRDSESKGAEVSESDKLTQNIEAEMALMRRVFFEDESSELILPLFSHPEYAQRVKVATAFAAFNGEYTHDEESGYPEKRTQFWKEAEPHIAHIQNALYEALIATAIDQTPNMIPYTLAWMPGQGEETVEMLAWAARHHSEWWVRRFSIFFVSEFGNNEPLAESLLSELVHDPEYKVRKEAFDLRIARLSRAI